MNSVYPRTRQFNRKCKACGLGPQGNLYEALPAGFDTICVTCRRQQRMFPESHSSAIDADSGQSMTHSQTTSTQKEGRA